MLKLFVAIQSKLAEVRSEEGQTMAEYGVVLAVITLVIVGTLLALSGAINGALEEVTGVLSRLQKHKKAREKRNEQGGDDVDGKDDPDQGRGRPDDGRVHGCSWCDHLAIVATFALLSGAINESYEKAIEVVQSRFLTLQEEGPRNHEPPPQHDPKRTGPDHGRVRSGRPDPLCRPLRDPAVRRALQRLRHVDRRCARRRPQSRDVPPQADPPRLPRPQPGARPAASTRPTSTSTSARPPGSTARPSRSRRRTHTRSTCSGSSWRPGTSTPRPRSVWNEPSSQRVRPGRRSQRRFHGSPARRDRDGARCRLLVPRAASDPVGRRCSRARRRAGTP